MGTGAATPTTTNVAGLAGSKASAPVHCGEGNQRQDAVRRWIRFREIVFSHTTRTTGSASPGSSRTQGMQGPTYPVTLYGPKGAQRILGAAITSGSSATSFRLR